MDLSRACFRLLLTAFLLFTFKPCGISAGDIVHDDDTAPKKPGCENDFVLVKVHTWVNGQEDMEFVGVGARFGATIVSKEKNANYSQLTLSDPRDCCSTPKTKLSGDVIMVQRGNCKFTTKANVAEAAGASAVLVINNQRELYKMVCEPDETDLDIHIPTVMLPQDAGRSLERMLSTNSSVSVQLYSPRRPTVDIAEIFLWLMAVGTILGASYWPAWSAREAVEHYNRLEQSESKLVYWHKVEKQSESVRKFASEFNSSERPLNLLINNAGIMGTPFTLSKDNIELQFATNHLGHFLLTNLVLDTMKRTAQESNIEGRIAIVSSRSHKWADREGIRFDKINDESGYNSMVAYGQSKLANILHANELARRLKEEGVNITANSLHPGGIVTNLLRHHSIMDRILKTVGKIVLKNVQQGAATTCYVALHPQVKGVGGEYFMDNNLANPSYQPKTESWLGSSGTSV